MFNTFNEADRRQMESLRISEKQVLAQVETFKRSSFRVYLTKPCTLDNAIRTIQPHEVEKYCRLHRSAADKGRFMKFVPASGAATRMFDALHQIYNRVHLSEYHMVCKTAEEGDPACVEFVRFVEGIRSFAFFEDLEQTMARDGHCLDTLIERGHFRPIIKYLLTDRGLNYAALPKGLLKFHRYPSERRTALEEHLVEAPHYVSADGGLCRIHFTVSPEHKESLAGFAEAVKRTYEQRYSVHYELAFSCQKPSTSTIAVDMANRPLRDDSGRLLFRPGGHGALLFNLNELQGDIVYIKNIDNLSPDHLKPTTFLWKKILGGCLVEIQENVHSLVRALKEGASSHKVARAERFLRDELLTHFPDGYTALALEKKREFLLSKLNRPIRVCGVVRNVGEPGGAPFWVQDKNGGLSVQIVEKAQVDFDSPEQRAVWMSSTHFNPVDLVCAVRDYRGKPFDLTRHTDPETVFITTKSKDGEQLKALELPGLWNGSMADWITVIVEVPKITFNPVKKICDLLRPEHLPEPPPSC
jgi:hypothetical protein